MTNDAALLHALRSSQRLGLLGAEPVESVVDRAGAFVDALASVSGSVIDLGSGGGVPGLVIAVRRADLHVVLVERRLARADHLRRLVGRLGIGDRVDVEAVDAATLSGGAADAVVARGFGPPAKVARAAGRLLRPGGRLVVSEPPGSGLDRWPVEVLSQHGLTQLLDGPDGRVFVALRQP